MRCSAARVEWLENRGHSGMRRLASQIEDSNTNHLRLYVCPRIDQGHKEDPTPPHSEAGHGIHACGPEFDMVRISFEEESAVWNVDICGAWLLSAHVVGCWVKSRNNHNPYL